MGSTSRNARVIIRRSVVGLIIGALGFTLGWWANELNRFATGVAEDARKRRDLMDMERMIDSIASLDKVEQRHSTEPDTVQKSAGELGEYVSTAPDGNNWQGSNE